MKRAVNIDWFEVYCEESITEYPCNAEYFRKRGYFVDERDYGTRVYNEMFTILDQGGNPMIEIRRSPASGSSSFTGLSQYSCHIRLVNWVCYQSNCMEIMRDFLLTHNYIFHRIYRIDICYDFEKFDSGDRPAAVARRIMEKKYLKINQGRITAHGMDNWTAFDWESLSWGCQSSMVSTKMYNKTKELAAGGHKKPYIYTEWMMCDLITNPMSLTKLNSDGTEYTPEIWRIEFSIKGKADSWKKMKRVGGETVAVEMQKHTLTMFDTKDKLWDRFRDLAYHYFRFKILTYKSDRNSVTANAMSCIEVKRERQVQRKDRMPDKVLFNFKDRMEFNKVLAVPKPSKPDNFLKRLRVLLEKYRETQGDVAVRSAAKTIIDAIDVRESYRMTPDFNLWEVKALQATIALKMQGDQRDTAKLINELTEIFKKENLW